MRQAKQVMKEILIGLCIWLILALVILLVIADNKLAAAAGVAVGGGAAAGLLFHMYRNLDIALDLDERHAQSHARAATLQRYIIMAAVLTLSMLAYEYIHPVGTVLGLFGMKIGAFGQPLVHKCWERSRQQGKKT